MVFFKETKSAIPTISLRLVSSMDFDLSSRRKTNKKLTLYFS